MRNSKVQPQYTYLANPNTLDVVRVKLNGGMPPLEIDNYLSKGYFKTRPEIFRRKKEGLLSEKSFKKVTVQVGEETKELWTNLNLID